MHAFPAAFPFRVSEETPEHGGVQIALTFEIAIESAVGEARAGHDLVNGDTLEAVAIEEPAGALDDAFLDGRAMTGWVWHGSSWAVGGRTMPWPIFSFKKKIFLKIF